MTLPIYEIFYLKVSSVNSLGNTGIADSIQEFSILRELGITCGGVCASINILDMDILTLVNIMLIATPNSGFNIFIKPRSMNLVGMAPDVIKTVADLACIPIPDGILDVVCSTIEAYADFAEQVQNIIFDKLIDMIDNNCAAMNVNVGTWDDLCEYYMRLKESGEMQQMQHIRAMTGGMVI